MCTASWYSHHPLSVLARLSVASPRPIIQPTMRLSPEEEPLTSYREAVRSRLQELMLRDKLPLSHPLVVATSLHLDMSTAELASSRHTAPSNLSFYQGCDLFYRLYTRPASPLSPQPRVL